MACRGCGTLGHIRAECESRSRNYGPRAPTEYFFCKDPSHVVAACPAIGTLRWIVPQEEGERGAAPSSDQKVGSTDGGGRRSSGRRPAAVWVEEVVKRSDKTQEVGSESTSAERGVPAMIIKDGKRQEAAQISEETKIIATAANTARASVVDVVEEITQSADGTKREVVEELGPVESVRNVCEATVTEE
ncbi:hypothetical protein PC114_g17637 [Phytophthora cactorum]|nr:hypothetical protein PC114_g17637 [Phytophthora cactorum]KAG3125811.1 hypothetical protein C6341_g25622 [Phytophthora cactorum]